MKGIVLAGGTGSRLHPMTKTTNKHLLPIGNYPMICHPIAKLAEAGITDVLVISGEDHISSIAGTLGNGNDIGLEFSYQVQYEPKGIAHALGLSNGFVGESVCIVVLGDNIFEESIIDFISRYERIRKGARLLLKEVPEPQRYGVAEIMDGCIISVEEKPEQPTSSICITGVYAFDSRVFDYIHELQPSARGEFEITDVIKAYLRDGELSYSFMEGWWTDAGTHESYSLANDLAKAVRLPLFDRACLANSRRTTMP